MGGCRHCHRGADAVWSPRLLRCLRERDRCHSYRSISCFPELPGTVTSAALKNVHFPRC